MRVRQALQIERRGYRSFRRLISEIDISKPSARVTFPHARSALLSSPRRYPLQTFSSGKEMQMRALQHTWSQVKAQPRLARNIAGLAGAAACFITSIVIPAFQWTSPGLAVLGCAALISSLCVSLPHHSQAPSWTDTARLAVGMFSAVFGVSALIGASLGHHDPLAPLMSETATRQEAGSPWRTVTTYSQLDTALAAASSAGSKVLIVWSGNACEQCDAANRIGALDPSINPKLMGYQLIRANRDTSEEMKLVSEAFKIGRVPAATLVEATGTVPEYGNIPNLNSASVMGALEASKGADQLSP